MGFTLFRLRSTFVSASASGFGSATATAVGSSALLSFRRLLCFRLVLCYAFIAAFASLSILHAFCLSLVKNDFNTYMFIINEKIVIVVKLLDKHTLTNFI